MTTQTLPINSLDFPEIKENLISYLKNIKGEDNVPVYQDFDFAASGISTLLNLLSYHTHYLGYYVKMMLNESFLDSAVKKESLFSKAKMTGYIPKGKRSSRADITMSLDVDVNSQPSSRSIIIPRGTSFTGTNTTSDQRVFYTIDDLFIKDIDLSVPDIAKYTSDVFTVYEGKFQEWKFLVDTTLTNQRYIIQDKSIDIDTIRLTVIPEGGLSGEDYVLSTGVFDIDGTSPIFYLSTNEDGLFEIVFGNNVFGKQPANRSKIIVHYLSSNGSSGNGCRTFNFNAPSQDIPTEYNVGNWEDFVVTIVPGTVSSGGLESENIDSIRFNIPNYFRRQNRIVTEGDYRSILLGEFRNIDSINVWGGEENFIKDYGKVYISIKPKYSDKLTLTSKQEIKNVILKKSCVIGMEPVFVDPEFIDISIDVYAKIDTRKSNKTAGQFEKQIIDSITEYNNENLNVFDNFLSDVTMLDRIMQDASIKSCYSRKTLEKTYQVIYASGIENVVLIGNPLKTGIMSSYFNYGNVQCYFKDDTNGLIYIYRKDTNAKFVIKSYGRVDYTNGIIYFVFPEFAFMTDINYGQSGLITFTAIPLNPDIESFLNNIIRISSIRVFITNA